MIYVITTRVRSANARVVAGGTPHLKFCPMLSHARLLPRAARVQNARTLAAVSSSSPPPNMNTVGPYLVFDRNVKRIQRDKAALREGSKRSRVVDYVRNEVAERMLDRFLVIRSSFPIRLTIYYVDLDSGY